MKDCPLCGGPGALRHTPKGLPFVQCASVLCGAASQSAPTEAEAITNWSRHVRAAEAVKADWELFPPPLAQAA